MTESKATCATCPWWDLLPGGGKGLCRHAKIGPDPDGCWSTMYDIEWCSEHPGRKLPDVHELAANLLASMYPSAVECSQEGLARKAYAMADAMLAEAKRRQGGE